MTPDKIVEEVLPDSFASGSDSYNAGFFGGRELLKQAIEQGRLIMPLSLEKIRECLIGKAIYGISDYDTEEELEHISINGKQADDLAAAIYQAQFKERV